MIDPKRLQSIELHDLPMDQESQITHSPTWWGEYLCLGGLALAHDKRWFTWKSSNGVLETIQQIDNAITLLKEAKRLMEAKRDQDV